MTVSPLVLVTTADTCWASAAGQVPAALELPTDLPVVEVRLDQDGWAQIAALAPTRVLVDLRPARAPRALLALVVRRHLPRASVMVIGPSDDTALHEQCLRSGTGFLAAEDSDGIVLSSWLALTEMDAKTRTDVAIAA